MARGRSSPRCALPGLLLLCALHLGQADPAILVDQTNPHLVRIFSTGLDPGLVTSDPNTPESGLNLLQPFGPSIQTHATSSTKVN
ncbi:hypothetical protein BDA96_01G320800 [Sorghum bicolor]|uniref:Uncharacterized protein n=1 Tax=Sorghum bicolor TaxID=4558 RepID=A0A921S2M6_SORBI|nr:hypothetical protein BDA96_01G320800 [Sorghum bicolor]